MKRLVLFCILLSGSAVAQTLDGVTNLPSIYRRYAVFDSVGVGNRIMLQDNTLYPEINMRRDLMGVGPAGGIKLSTASRGLHVYPYVYLPSGIPSDPQVGDIYRIGDSLYIYRSGGAYNFTSPPPTPDATLMTGSQIVDSLNTTSRTITQPWQFDQQVVAIGPVVTGAPGNAQGSFTIYNASNNYYLQMTPGSGQTANRQWTLPNTPWTVSPSFADRYWVTGTVGGRPYDSSAASAGKVLLYDGTKWVLKDTASFAASGAMTGAQIVSALNLVSPIVWGTPHFFDDVIYLRNGGGQSGVLDPDLLTGTRNYWLPDYSDTLGTRGRLYGIPINSTGKLAGRVLMYNGATWVWQDTSAFGGGGTGSMDGASIVATINGEVPNVEWETDHLFKGGFGLGTTWRATLMSSLLTGSRYYYLPMVGGAGDTIVTVQRLPTAGWGIKITNNKIELDSTQLVTPQFSDGEYVIAQGDTILKNGSLHDTTLVGGTNVVAVRKALYLENGFAQSIPDSMLPAVRYAVVIDSSRLTTSTDIPIFYTNSKFLVDSVVAVHKGAPGSPSVHINVTFDSDASAGGTNVFNASKEVTSKTTGDRFLPTGVSDTDAISANSWVRVKTPTITTKCEFLTIVIIGRHGR